MDKDIDMSIDMDMDMSMPTSMHVVPALSTDDREAGTRQGSVGARPLAPESHQGHPSHVPQSCSACLNP